MKLILYDGSCNLCHWAVQWVKKNAVSSDFQFEAIESEFGQKILEKHPSLKQVDSVIFLDSEGVFVKSEAVFQIAKYLKRPWPMLQLFRIFPKSMSDGFYTFIAKNRKKWFGTKNTCEL